jgi:predicted dehydrogenase
MPHPVDRRTFFKTLSAAGLGLAALGGASLASAADSTATGGRRKRYVNVGVGGRHLMYQDAIEKAYPAHAELVGICDTNAGRLELARAHSMENGATPPPAYLARDFDRMIGETKPDYVIVTTIDATHVDYIVRAMELGCDVISEKPMTTDAAKVQRILDAKQRTGRNLRVTFNYRYSPPRTQVKDLLMRGEIGDILSVDFHWMLNTHHGADYFRRWHANKKNSGGLMVHKASHHFDLVNWWLAAVPVQVFATGKREFYTPAMAKRLGLQGAHERCHTCPEKDKCTFFFDLAADPKLKAMYLDQEKHDGYFRDQCVWRPSIDIEDTMNVLVTYDNGVTMAYSLNAFNAWEGYHIVFNGTKGRLEHSIVEQVYGDGAASMKEAVPDEGVTTRIIPLRGAARTIKPDTGAGQHAGGDTVMLDEIFLPSAPADKYRRLSDERAGAASCLVGIAADRCFETGQPVKIADLVKGLARPDYAPMPTHVEPVPMPPKVKPIEKVA